MQAAWQTMIFRSEGLERNLDSISLAYGREEGGKRPIHFEGEEVH